jgi:hypothetical protein
MYACTEGLNNALSLVALAAAPPSCIWDLDP